LRKIKSVYLFKKYRKILTMEMFSNVVVVLQILAAVAMIGLVLVQHGKGADMGASFGSGSSGSLFGATGSANFLSRSTAIAATVFFCTTLALGYFATQRNSQASVGGASVLDRVAPAESPASSPALAASGVQLVPAAAPQTASASGSVNVEKIVPSPVAVTESLATESLATEAATAASAPLVQVEPKPVKKPVVNRP
jgi:preprotein translocase subunit SecG